MAYAAVVSLSQTLECVLQGHEILYNKEQIGCFIVKLTYLQAFLEDYSTKSRKEVRDLETQIGNLACAANDVVDSYTSSELLSACECCTDRNYTIFCQDLENLLGKFDTLISNVMELRDMDSKTLESRNSFPDGFSSRVKNVMVGFGDEVGSLLERHHISSMLFQ